MTKKPGVGSPKNNRQSERGSQNNPSKASSDWLSIVKDVFSRWCDRLRSSKDAKDKLDALLCDPETRSAKHRIDVGGEEIPGTSSFVGTEFWQDQDRLLLVPDADGGPDHLAVDYTDAAEIYLPSGHWEFYVRRTDVERWEGLYFPTTATPVPSNEKAKPGPKPDFPWEKIEAKCYELMDDNGDFTPDDPDWDCQARLETALMNFCQKTWRREPGGSTLRDKLPGWLLAWRQQKTGET
jgi:hypothetical protein